MLKRFLAVDLLKEYCSLWWTIMLRPIYFFTRLKEEPWQDKPLTFLLLNAWVLGGAAALVIFIIQYIPIGATLVSGVSGIKFIIVLPILITLAFVFFLITFLILGGVFAAAFFMLFYFVAWLLHYTAIFLGGKGEINRIMQGVFYSSAATQVALLIFLLMLLPVYANMPFTLFRVGFNFVFFLAVLFMYGLWSVAVKRTYKIKRWQAFVAAILPFVALLLFAVIFDKIALLKLEPWIS